MPSPRHGYTRPISMRWDRSMLRRVASRACRDGVKTSEMARQLIGLALDMLDWNEANGGNNTVAQLQSMVAIPATAKKQKETAK
jgi:hypothetical protein